MAPRLDKKNLLEVQMLAVGIKLLGIMESFYINLLRKRSAGCTIG